MIFPRPPDHCHDSVLCSPAARLTPYAYLWTVRDEKVVKFEQFAGTKLSGPAVGK